MKIVKEIVVTALSLPIVLLVAAIYSVREKTEDGLIRLLNWIT